MTYITITQVVERTGYSRQWILVLAKRPGSGAIRPGRDYLLPENWEPPKFPRGRRKGEKQTRRKSK